MHKSQHKIVAFLCRTHCALCVEQNVYKIAFLDTSHHFESSFLLELGKEAFDANSLDADRCESCCGAESEDVR